MGQKINPVPVHGGSGSRKSIPVPIRTASQRTIRLNASGVGIGTTVCRRVFVNVNQPVFDTSGIGTQSTSTVAGYGDYSWGKITLLDRAGVNTYTSFTNDGILGITTSMRVERSAPLRFKNYIT